MQQNVVKTELIPLDITKTDLGLKYKANNTANCTIFKSDHNNVNSKNCSSDYVYRYGTHDIDSQMNNYDLISTIPSETASIDGFGLWMYYIYVGIVGFTLLAIPIVFVSFYKKSLNIEKRIAQLELDHPSTSASSSSVPTSSSSIPTSSSPAQQQLTQTTDSNSNIVAKDSSDIPVILSEEKPESSKDLLKSAKDSSDLSAQSETPDNLMKTTRLPIVSLLVPEPDESQPSGIIIKEIKLKPVKKTAKQKSPITKDSNNNS